MRSPRSEWLFVKDMRESAGRVFDYTKGMEFEDFVASQITIDAVLRNFEIIGEAAGRVSDETRNLAPAIEWQRLKDFRNVVAHFYAGLEYEVVWKIIQTNLPPLMEQLLGLEPLLPRR